MAKVKHKAVRFTPEEIAYELPAELNLDKLRFVGHGPQVTGQLRERSRCVVGLDPDVAKDFPTAKAVNDGLRKLREIQRLVQPAKKKRTA